MLSSDDFARFYANPLLYPDEVKNLDETFAHYRPVFHEQAHGYEVYILATSSS